MSDEQLKLECLRMALSHMRDNDETMRLAQQMYDWIKAHPNTTPPGIMRTAP
jgi:hypothetical protein